MAAVTFLDSSGMQTAIEHHSDVVVTDLDMPAMTGLQLCQAIRADPHLADIPVGILSGSLLLGDPRAAGAQACGVWLKPFDGDELVTAVQHLINAGRHHHGHPSPCSLSAAPT